MISVRPYVLAIEQVLYTGFLMNCLLIPGPAAKLQGV